jgi:3-phosphoshikimate 1-carboxyvinyltransferase
VKESDRITALVTGLRALGVEADERPDGFVVRGRVPPPAGVRLRRADHRLVMAFAVAALGARGRRASTTPAPSRSISGSRADLARLVQ